jgi:hypothetical protein
MSSEDKYETLEKIGESIEFTALVSMRRAIN